MGNLPKRGPIIGGPWKSHWWMWWLLGWLLFVQFIWRFLWIVSWPNSPKPVFGGGSNQPIHVYTFVVCYYGFYIWHIHLTYIYVYIFRSCILRISGRYRRCTDMHNILELHTIQIQPQLPWEVNHPQRRTSATWRVQELWAAKMLTGKVLFFP